MPQPHRPSPDPLTLVATADRALIRASAPSTRYVVVSYTAPTLPERADRIPVNAALVLDRSGSMGGSKFALARQAAEQALAQLRSEDRFSLVVYDDHIDVLIPSSPATAEAKQRAREMLARTEARGGTDLCGGWLRGCEQVAAHAAADGVNRCLLLTDGLANHGITSHDEILGHAAALRERGVQTSAFGVGADFDERLLQAMAHAGGGHFYFIESPAQIPDLVASELGEALETVVQRAVVEVRLPEGVRAEPLNRFRWQHARAENVVRIELGDLVSGQAVDLVVKLSFPVGAPGDVIAAEFGLVDGAGIPAAPSATARWTYAPHKENDRQPRERAVDRQVATLYAARARAEATEHNRAGYFERARSVLTATARRIRSYANGDPELERIANELLREVETFVEPMPAMAMKAMFAVQETVMQMRSPDQKARRR